MWGFRFGSQLVSIRRVCCMLMRLLWRIGHFLAFVHQLGLIYVASSWLKLEARIATCLISICNLRTHYWSPAYITFSCRILFNENDLVCFRPQFPCVLGMCIFFRPQFPRLWCFKLASYSFIATTIIIPFKSFQPPTVLHKVPPRIARLPNNFSTINATTSTMTTITVVLLDNTNTTTVRDYWLSFTS